MVLVGPAQGRLFAMHGNTNVKIAASIRSNRGNLRNLERMLSYVIRISTPRAQFLKNA